VKPIIGISSWRGLATTDELAVPHLLTHASYVRAVEKAGGLPIVLPELVPDDVGGLLERVDGVVLVGGPDVDPRRYGESPVPETECASPERDAFDIALAQQCVERDIALLAICRGVQVLNVALGGSLTQHVPEHMVRERWNEDVHPVEIEPGSALLGIVEAGQIGTNSLHHQALRDLGSRARAVAHSSDGTVEAIEIDGARRVLGVQWHPELLRHRSEHLALFKRVVELAESTS